MYIPSLVETQVKNVLNHNLKQCHNLKFQYQSLFFNILCFLFIFSLVSIILYVKYKGNNNEERIQKENKKRDYILYNLRKFQYIKNKHLTNIPLH